MTDREMLINEINGLPDFIIRQLLDIVHYVKIGTENEYVPETENDFYNSREFGKLVSDAVSDYKAGETQDMDILK